MIRADKELDSKPWQFPAAYSPGKNACPIEDANFVY
jgi:hypothetical protein